MLKYILISFLIITNVYAYTCEEMGYTKTIADCPDGGLKCPAQPEKMFCCSRCGDGSGFRYNEENCSPDDGLQLTGVECEGRWTECRQCTSEYKYNKDNCRSPKILAGVQCGNSYTQCVYPVGTGCVPTVGYIYYSDNSCHAEYDDTKEPIGIIVDAARKLMVALDGENLAWSKLNDWNNSGLPSYKTVADTLLEINGENNTDIIIDFLEKTGQQSEVLMYCPNKNTGNRKWYLPALGELNILYNNIVAIQNGLANTSSSIELNRHYSSTRSPNNIWFLNITDGHKGYDASSASLRCFSKF